MVSPANFPILIHTFNAVLSVLICLVLILCILGVKNTESVYESVLITSDADALTACRNIANRTSRKIRNAATILVFIPFEEFGSLANVHDFNKQSSLKAMALTRKECEFLRRVKLM